MNNKDKIENLSPLKRALIAVEEMQQKLKKVNAEKNEPIAVIGLSGRFPQADSIDEYWKLLINKEDGIIEVPKERWDVDEFYDPKPNTPGKMITRYGGFINDFDKFDAQFFGISPREALKMDPQQRLLLQTTWEALEDAAINANELSGTKTGVFIGISTNDYSMVQNEYSNNDYTIIDAYQGSGNASSIAANRLSYFLNLQGPSLSVDTACSSSLVSTHLACQSLRNKEADLAIAGGVGLILSPHASITFSQANMLAPNGRCKTFDADAEGYVRGEGVGIVILKRLSDAIKNNDNILAIIKSSAVNQDGKTNGLTAPNSLSQAAVIKEALKKAKLSPEDIGFIETHGTGTILGDPIEIQALGMVMKNRTKDNPCYLGAAKSNIGHLEAAAGIAGLIKTILVLKNKTIPPNLHFNKINPHIPIDELPFVIPTKSVEWNTDKKRYAGVSSFGFGGTNAHIILQEANIKKYEHNEIERPKNILSLSAYEESSLKELSKKYVKFINTNSALSLHDICYTANTGRYSFPEKIAIPFETKDELLSSLNDFIEGNENYSIIRSIGNFEPEKIAFLFTGQGSQYPNMAKELYKTQPIFKENLDLCFNIAQKYLSKPLEKIIFTGDSNSNLIDETEFTQPALFAIEYAFAKMWMAWGIKPDYLIGHSIGEYVAACIADVFELEEGIKLTALRGRLMQSLPKTGSMAVLFSDEENVKNILSNVSGKISIAGINGKDNIVISGDKKSVELAIKISEENGIEVRKLNVSHAFHSPLMEPILDEFEKVAATINYKKPKIKIISNLTGKELNKEEITDAVYWKNHIRKAVRFYDGMKTLTESGCNVFIETGPNPVLIGMGKRSFPNLNAVWVGSIKKNQNDWDFLLQSIGELFTSNVPFNWKGFDEGYKRYKVQLPTYAFKKERYYVEQNGKNINLSGGSNKGIKCLIKYDENNKKILRIVDKENNLLLELNNVDVIENVSEEIFNNVNLFAKSNSEQKENEEVEKKVTEEFSLENIKSLSHDEQKRIISDILKKEIGKVLKLNVNRIDSGKSITHLGLDSIMAIELKNNLSKKYKFSVPVAELVQGPSVNQLTEIIIKHLADDENGVVKLQHQKVAEDKFELSYGQNAMWFQHQMAPESIFNPTYAVRIKSKIDIDKFKNVIAKIVERHEALRTTYHFANGQPVQKIHKKIDTPFTFYQVENLTELELKEKINTIANEIFDLENGPVFKTNLFKIKENDFIFLISAHHIAVDFWSQAIIINEISQLYQAESSIDLPTSDFSYLDFVVWQKKFVKSSKGEKQLHYWTNKLEGEIPNLDLPTKKIRKPVQTFNGASYTTEIEIENSNKLKDISERNNATLYMSLFSIFQILLNKYTHQDDIIVGTPTTGRSLSELKNIVGYFVNPLPVRTQLHKSDTFETILQKVKENIVGTLDNQDYPFNLIVEKIQPERDASRSPIFQVMFVYQKAHVLAEEGLSGFAVGKENSTMQLGNLPIESYSIDENKSAFDLTLLMAETKEGITATVTYNTDLFEEKYIKRFLTHYKRLVKLFTENPKEKLSNIALVDKVNNSLLKYTKSDLTKKYSFVFNDFEKITKKFPDKIAVQYKNNILTFDELNKAANKLSNYLLSKNVKPEMRIGVFVERSFDMIISILAVMKAGCVYVPIDTVYPIDRIKSIVNDAEIEVIISHSKHCNKIEEIVNEVVCLDTEEENLKTMDDSNPNVFLDEQNLAYSIYTSGSTGKPKGVMLTHKGLSNLVKNQTQIFGITKESKVLQLASLSFDASVSEIFTSLVNGATLHLVSQDVLLSGSALINEINERKVSVATIPPSLLAVLPSDKLPELKTLVSAGEACTKDVVQKWSNGRKFINAYGPTEVTVCATTYNIENSDEILSIGSSINGINSYILDENLNPVPVCVPGELCISGIGLARGYNNMPDLTAVKFIPNPFATFPGERLYRTGDLVKLRDDGKLEYLGRIDDQVKFRGFRIELSEIQTVLEQHTDIIKAELLLKKFNNEKKLVAYYVSKDNKEIENHILRDYVINHLPEYMLPSLFVKVDSIPLTHNGKVNKKALAKIKIQSEVRNKYVKPESEIEKEIVEIWQDVLKVNNISTSDNFFELGGHSLNIIEVQTKIKEKLNKDLTVVDLFKYPTVKMFAEYLSNGNNIEKKVEEVKQRADKRKKILEQQKAKMRNRRKPN